MRYVLYAFAIAAAAMVWTQTTDKGRSVKRQLSSHPVDERWSH